MPSSEVMPKYGKGTLHSGGPGGPVVHNQKQAVAIMLSEKRKEAAHGGTYPESNHAEGGPVAKGYMSSDQNFAQGGAVLPRTGDWKKEVPNRGFLDTPDRFRSDGGKSRDPKPEPTEDNWGKGSSKSNPKPADKFEKAIKPR